MAYCQNTPALNGVFICDCFRRLVYNYRIEHPTGQPEPLASLVAGEKLAWSECIDNLKVGRWISERATAQKLDQRAINCITQKFIVGFNAQPKLNRMNELYNESVTACNK